MEESNVKDEERMSRLLGSLDVVGAPENFEGRVRSRIADRRASASLGRPVLWLVLKFAAPMLLLVFLGAFLIATDDRPMNVEMVPPVESSGIALADLAIDEPSSTNASVVDNAVARSGRANRNAGPAPVEPLSQDRALSQDDSTRFPPGVDPRRAVPKDQKPPSGDRVISPLNILSFIGISSGCSPVSCTVRTVRPASPAERSGVREGDIIEAIDDRAIDSTHLYSGEVSVRSLRVVRGGKRITIPLVFR